MEKTISSNIKFSNDKLTCGFSVASSHLNPQCHSTRTGQKSVTKTSLQRTETGVTSAFFFFFFGALLCFGGNLQNIQTVGQTIDLPENIYVLVSHNHSP